MRLLNMIHIIIASILIIALVILGIRVFPMVFPYIQKLVRNPIVQALLFRGLWRLIKRIIFKR